MRHALVVKVGSSSLTTVAGRLDPDRLDRLVDAIAARRRAGAPGGARVLRCDRGRPRPARAGAASPRPRHPAGGRQRRPAAAGRALRRVLRPPRADGRAGAADRRRPGPAGHYRNAQRTLDRLLGLGVVPIVNENDTVATDEIRFGDNDRLAALVAHLV